MSESKLGAMSWRNELPSGEALRIACPQMRGSKGRPSYTRGLMKGVSG